MKKQISPQEAARSGRRIIDVREYPEYAASSIRNATLTPLATVEEKAAGWRRDEPLTLVCRSGKRATMAAEKLEQLGFTDLAVMSGGMEGWQQSGLPVETSDRRPWSLERQVRAIAGSMVVAFTLLGLTVSPWFFGLTLFVGAGLTFAGVTDVCLMATLLGKMPWNRQTAGSCAR